MIFELQKEGIKYRQKYLKIRHYFGISLNFFKIILR